MTTTVPRRIGRYELLERRGSGGMGVVYEALDELADRKVALKLLRRSDSPNERDRLAREARALARLSHPNVVQVFEVGQWNDRAYLVMELVDGARLDHWLEAERPGVREILDVFLQAGEGLAAAHRAGLVHRDFKPGNVLVGTDGRVRVVDFGLARTHAGLLSEATSTPSTPSSSTSWDPHLTRTGAMLGTPAYMSPEQLGRDPLTATSDQFSFCVTLYQALYREHPFSEDGDVHQILHNVLQVDARPPPSHPEVAKRLRAALLRGLSRDPRARWASMDELLHELRRGTSRPARRGITLAMLATLAAGGGTWLMLAEDDPAQTCAHGSAKLDEAWGPARRDAVEQAFLAVGSAHAEQTSERVVRRLDDYGATWRATYAQACEAGPRELPLLDHRMACLERLRLELGTQVGVLEEADEQVAASAVSALAALRSPRSCLETSSEAPATAEHPELDRSAALHRSGKYSEALETAARVVTEAAAAKDPRVEARATLAVGRAHASLGEDDEARRHLEQAYFLAQQLDDRPLVLQAATELVTVVGVKQQDHAQGLEWGRHAEAALDRGRDPLAEAELLGRLGGLHRARGELLEALETHQRSLQLYRSVLEPDHLEIGHALSAIGIDLRQLGRYEDALEHHEEALTIVEEALGPEHPELAKLLGNLATAQLRTKRKERAAETMRRSIAVLEANVGADSVLLARDLANFSVITSELGRHDEAEQAAQRAIDLLEASGTQPHTRCAAVANLANARHAAGRHERAAEAHRRAVAACEDAGLEDHIDFAQVLFNYATTLEKLGELSSSEEHVRRAIAILERSEEPMEERIMLMQGLLATVCLGRAHFEDAIAVIERWMELETVVSPPPYYRAKMEWMLARAHLGAGRLQEAVVHARDADRRAAALGDRDRDQRLREEIQAWRSEHDPP